MKRILLLGVLVIFGALALQAESPWALTAWVNPYDYEDVDEDMSSIEKLTLLPIILRGEPINVGISYLGSDPSDYSDYILNQFNEVNKAFNAWFSNAAEKIKEQKREEEFQDMLEILEKGVSLERDKPTGAGNRVFFVEHLRIYFVQRRDLLKKNCPEDAIGCLVPGDEQHPMMIFVLEDDYSTLLHEVGHALGVADASKRGYKENASDEVASAKRTEETVMSDKEDAQLTADDADAIINIIDLMRKDDVEPRVQKGWKSLNRINGKPVDCYAWGSSVKFLLAGYRKKATNCASFQWPSSYKSRKTNRPKQSKRHRSRS